MKYLRELNEYPLEKRVAIFMRNDRESPKGQRPLPNNQNSYVVRDQYPFTDGTTGYFMNLVLMIYRMLSKDKINITEVRAMNYTLNWYDWPEYLWNKLMVALKQNKLIVYNRECYSKRFVKGIKRAHLEEQYPYCIRRETLSEADKQPYIMWPYAKSVYFLHKSDGEIYGEIASRYLFERESDRSKFGDYTLYIMHREPEVDPRGPGLRIYPHYTQFDYLQGEALVEAYLDSEPMMELILARCEQEVEIRINESLISVEEVIDRVRWALEQYFWRLEVRL